MTEHLYGHFKYEAEGKLTKLRSRLVSREALTVHAATLELGGYIQLSAEGLGVGSGMWMMAPDQLERYRRAASDEASGEAPLERRADTDHAREEPRGAPVGDDAPPCEDEAEAGRGRSDAAW